MGNTPKRRLFWVVTLLSPMGLLLVLELALRALGFGYPVHFFVRAADGAPGYYTENQRFGWQFFPRRMARAPDPIRITRQKAPGTYRIFVFGESAALGDPEPAYSFSRILRELLEERCPGTRFEVVNVGMTAINSHAILRIARDCAAFESNLWIVYMGNNEVVGPFGAGSVFGARAPPRPLLGLLLAVKHTCLGQALDALPESLSAHGGQPTDWQGMKMFLDQQVRSDDPVLQRVYSSFRGNLRDLVSIARRAGVRTLVCSVSCNLRDCPPFASLNRKGLPEAQKLQWTNLVQRGIELESGGHLPEARAQYRQAAEIDGSNAALCFRLARCCRAVGEAEAARENFLRARDLDTLRFRADSAINDEIRMVCAASAPAIPCFDTDLALRNGSPEEVPGAEFFWDHVHFNFAGNYHVARGLAEQVIQTLALVPRATGQNLTEAECAERLAITAWDQRLIMEQMWRRFQEPPFTDQLDHAQRLEQWAGVRAEVQQKTGAQGLALAADVYRRALARRPDDWILHHRFGLLLETLGDLPAAEQQWTEVIRLMPGYPDALYKLGEVCSAQGRFAEAVEYYQRVLRVRADSFEALNGLGLVRMSEGNLGEATKLFEQAVRANPKFAQAHVNLGLVCARSGALVQAKSHYREALRADPECAAAHINLGNLLAAQADHTNASVHYREAMRLRPENAAVHLSLANSLQALGRDLDALAQYREAVRLNPSLPEAQFNLGVALARTGDLAGATPCFQAAARLTPADPQAHLNLGVALARQGLLAEAIPEFETVLRLDPANQAASGFLKTARQHSR